MSLKGVSFVKVCPNCGSPLLSDLGVCSVCSTTHAEYVTGSQQNAPQQQNQGQSAAEDAQGKRLAKASLICGISGICIAGIILGTLAIIFSRKAKKKGYKGGIATAGFVLGIIGAVAAVLLVIALILVISLKVPIRW